MDRIFAVLFTLYVVSSVIVAIVRKLRTEMDPALPPVVRPDLFPWESDWKDEQDQDPGREDPGRGPEATVSVEEPLEPPAARTDSAVRSGAMEPGLSEWEPSISPQRELQPAPAVGGPVPSLPGGRAGKGKIEASVSRAAWEGARLQLTPARVRDAVIVAELLAPPRALRPYRPFFRAPVLKR